MRKTLTALFIAAALPTFAMAAPAANDLPPLPMEGGHMMGQHGPRHGGPDEGTEPDPRTAPADGQTDGRTDEGPPRDHPALPGQAAGGRAEGPEGRTQGQPRRPRRIRALLTPEQQKKFDELQKKREQRKAEWAEFQQWKADKKSTTDVRAPLPGPPVAVFQPESHILGVYPRGRPDAIQQENHAFTLWRILAVFWLALLLVAGLSILSALNQDTWIIARHPGLKDLAESSGPPSTKNRAATRPSLLEQRRRDYGISIQVLDESGQRLVDGTYLPRPSPPPAAHQRPQPAALPGAN